MSEHLKKVNKGGKKIFKAGSEMSENTYGGKTLEQMQQFFTNPENEEIFETKPTKKNPAARTPFAGFKPTSMSPSEIRTSNTTQSPKNRGGVATPLSKQQPPSPGYVNLIPNKTINKQQQQQQQQRYDDEDEIFSDDEDQEIYIQPGNMGSDGEEEEESIEDQPLYENTTFKKDSQPSSPPPSQDDAGIYQNYVVTPPKSRRSDVEQIQAKLAGIMMPQNGGSRPNSGSKPRPTAKPQTSAKPSGSKRLYANVTYDGKPLTQPRQKYAGGRT